MADKQYPDEEKLSVEGPKIVKNIAKKTAAILLIGGLVYYMPASAVVCTIWWPRLCAYRVY